MWDYLEGKNVNEYLRTRCPFGTIFFNGPTPATFLIFFQSFQSNILQ